MLSSFFLILSILKLFIIKTDTEFTMDKICSSGDFDQVEHKEGYRTIQHYADDQNIELTDAHPFYRTLFLEGKKLNLNVFINSIILELVIEGIAAIAFINYFIFLFLWCGNCCLFRKLSDKEKLKKLSHCKYCPFIIMLIYFIISLALSIFGILYMSPYKKALKLSDCGLLRFTNHGIYGINQSFAGTYNLKDSFFNSSYSLNQIEIFYSKMFPYHENISSSNIQFNQRMTDCNTYAVDDSVFSPNPETDKFNFITMNYQSIYGPKTNAKTMLGIINQKYEKKIKPIINALNNLKNYFERMILNKNAYITELKKYGEYFDQMKLMYESINRNIGKVYYDYIESGSKTVYYIAFIFYFIFPILLILILIFIFIYVCKKEATIFVNKTARIIINILWNLLFVFSALSLILSGYIGTYRKYSYNLIPSFNHLISSNIIMDKTSEENLFIEFANNPNILKSLELFNACYNSSQSTNIANILGIRDSLLYYFDLILKEYNQLLFYTYNNNLEEDIETFITEQKSILDTYLINMTKTTSYETHNEHDVSKFIKELNKYTNYDDENTFQIKCVTNSYDIWVYNKDDCPNGYIYNLDGSHTKNCLVIQEWIHTFYDLKYKPVCKTKNNYNTREKVDFYLDRLVEYYDKNKQLIINMKNGIDILIDLHDELINLIKLELTNDNNTFLNFTLPFSMFTTDSDIFHLFDCGILKDDLIDFYDFTRHKLSTISIIHIICLLMIAIFNIAGIYLLIRILQVFSRIPNEDKEEISFEEIKDKNIKQIYNKNSINMEEKDVLSIKKGNKKEVNKGKNKAKTSDISNDKPSKESKDKKGTKAKIYARYGKNRSDSETPSSSEEKLRTTQGNFDNKTDEEKDSEENENNNKNKDLDTSNDENEIEEGIRDDGSAMS